MKLEQAVYGAVGGPHQGIIYSAAAAAAAFAANNSDNSTIGNQSYSNIHQPPEAKRARIDVSPSSSGISPPDMAAAGLGGSGEEVYTNSMENGKIKTANSVDSLDNCSTVSSSDPSNQVSLFNMIIHIRISRKKIKTNNDNSKSTFFAGAQISDLFLLDSELEAKLFFLNSKFCR